MNDMEPAKVPETTVPARRRSYTPSWWGQVGLMLVTFVAGGVVGAMIATKTIYSRMHYYRQHADALPRDILPRLKSRLAMTDDQASRVREIIERRHPRMIERRQQGAQGMLTEFKLMEDEIAEVLDAEQAEMWRSIANSVRLRFLPPLPSE